VAGPALCGSHIAQESRIHNSGGSYACSGIGANTAIFSIVNGVLLQPLPYLHSEELVVVARTEPRFDHPVPVSGPNFLDWRVRAKEFQSLAGFDGRGFALMLGNEPEHILGAAVSYNFLQVLQVVPAFGRDFLKSEEHLAMITSFSLATDFGSNASAATPPQWAESSF